jgi:hypothetical protein
VNNVGMGFMKERLNEDLGCNDERLWKTMRIQVKNEIYTI